MTDKPLAAIVAMARNNIIGSQGDLPWRISEDLKHFKATTMGHVILMGRITYESIGRPLPGRTTYVLSKRIKSIPRCEVFGDIEEAIDAARKVDKMPFVVGGAKIYEEAMPFVTHLHLTDIDRDVDGDCCFPEFDRKQWEEIEARKAETQPDVVFRLLKRR